VKILHAFNGTKHRVLLVLDDGSSKAGSWVSITEPARFAIKPRESLVLVTRYCVSGAFPRPESVYRVEEMGEIDGGPAAVGPGVGDTDPGKSK
jgi:hypothetical protein